MSNKRSRVVVAAATASVIVGLVANAHGTIRIMPVLGVPISAGAKTDDVSLSISNYVCYDLRISISPGDHWLRGELHAGTIPESKFYAADNTQGGYTPEFQSSTRTGERQLAYDTAIMAPGFSGSRVRILGSSSRKLPAPDQIPTFPSNGHNWQTGEDVITGDPVYAPANDMRIVDVSWADNDPDTNTSIGIVTIARFTMVHASNAEGFNFFVVGSVTSASAPNAPVPFSINPEPASLALICTGLGAMALRRRKFRTASAT